MFVKNATSLADWIEETPLLMTKDNHEWEGIIGALQTFKKLHDFMAKTVIKDEEVVQYNKTMKDFEKDVIEFYEHGKQLFLKDHHPKIGGSETACMHTLCFYVPKMTAHAWKELHVGLGIFNTQGVEAQNKESTFIWDHGMNNWVHLRCRQVMNKLHNIFKC